MCREMEVRALHKRYGERKIDERKTPPLGLPACVLTGLKTSVLALNCHGL